jgi:hypothetical protein
MNNAKETTKETDKFFTLMEIVTRTNPILSNFIFICKVLNHAKK